LKTCFPSFPNAVRASFAYYLLSIIYNLLSITYYL